MACTDRLRPGNRLVILRDVKALAPGFLLAMPQLGDPNFHRSVVLMLEHGEGGSMGLVVNHPSNLTLRDLGQGQNLPVSAHRNADSVFVGGPVEPQRGFVLHDRAEVPDSQQVLPGLFLSLTLDALGPLLADEAGRIRFVLGYAGWGPQQLEQEMTQGSWLFAEAEPTSVLDTPAGELWDDILRKMGVDPAMLQPGKGVH